MSFEIDRHRYAELFGPTEGDSIRLGDTDLFIKIEKDYTGYGNGSSSMYYQSKYSASNNYNGPDIVATVLPKTTNWSKVSLKNTHRQILNTYGENRNTRNY